MATYWMLNEAGDPVAVDDVLAWARWFEVNRAQQRVARTEVTPDVTVSTVFLGIDHQWGAGPPVLYETLTFGLDDAIQDRYSTRAEALAGHAAVVEQVRERIAPTDQPGDDQP